MLNKEEYLLICLAEEAAEIQQAITKWLRFGKSDVHPKTGIENVEELRLELQDFIAILDMLAEEEIFDLSFIEEEIEAKKEKVEKYMKYSIDRDRLE